MTTAPDGIAAGPEPEDEARSSLALRSDRQRRVAETLTLLARTARSFTLYDVDNDAIRSFIDRLLQAFDTILASDPEISLDLGPFEMRWQGEVIYLDRDWERSLAFRLYRDGVRSVSIRQGFGWRDLARLLEVLSIRYTGINQNEEDLVTLLWKAGFEHVSLVSVRGFEPEDSPEELRDGGGRRGDLSLPDDIDLPMAPAPQPREPEWTEPAAGSLAALRDLVSPEALPDDCLRLVSIIESELQEALEPMAFQEVEHVFGEIRDYLVSEGRLAPLLVVVRGLQALASRTAPSWDPLRRGAVERLLSTFGDLKTLRKMIQSVPEDVHQLPPEILQILDLVCRDPLALSADLLEIERSASGRVLARQLVERYGQTRFEWVRERYEQSHGDVASDLIRVMSRLPGERNDVFFALQASNPDPAAQDEALHHLERLPYSGTLGRWIFDAYRKADEVRRARLLSIMDRSKDRRFVLLLGDLVEDRAQSLTLAEASDVGRVMGRLGGEEVVDYCDKWLRTGGLLRRSLSGPLPRQVAAVSALAEIPGVEAEEILADTEAIAGHELRPMVEDAIARRTQRAPR